MAPQGNLLGVMVGRPGWVAVFAYCAAAFGCARAALYMSSCGENRWGRADRFWTCLAVLMVILGINKRLDLPTRLTDIGRGLFQSLGAYGARRSYQVAFIVAVALLGVALYAACLWLSRRRLSERWLAITGMVFLLGFVAIRAASFHQVDALLGSRIGGLRWSGILELCGIGAVCLASFRVASRGETTRCPE